jgi:hypothetical protein
MIRCCSWGEEGGECGGGLVGRYFPPAAGGGPDASGWRGAAPGGAGGKRGAGAVRRMRGGELVWRYPPAEPGANGAYAFTLSC